MKQRESMRSFLRMASYPVIVALVVLSHFGYDTQAQKRKPTQEKKDTEFKPLNKQKTVLLDIKGKRLLLKTKVVLREGLLEMLCCLKQTKEHESILALDAKAYTVHTGLLAVGAKPGKPVQFFPKYVPAEGQKIDIFLQWKDKEGKHHRVRAQKWIRYGVTRYFGEKLDPLPKDLNLPKKSGLFYDDAVKELIWFGHMTKEKRDELLKLSQDAKFQKAIRSLFSKTKIKEMDTDWIFAGSRLHEDKRSGRKFYAAEEGHLICVSNFPIAMIDVKAKSSSEEADVLFEPFTDRIPPLETEVTIELIPVLETKKKSK